MTKILALIGIFTIVSHQAAGAITATTTSSTMSTATETTTLATTPTATGLGLHDKFVTHSGKKFWVIIY